jgi:small redox-active disulfide protein 2
MTDADVSQIRVGDFTAGINGMEIREEIMDIKVLGPGCPKCQQTEKNVKEAVADTGVDAKVEKVTNLLEIAKYGVFGTPAVVIDGQVKSVGKIPTKDEIKKWIFK